MMRATFLISAAAAFAVSVPAQAANPTDAQIAHIAYTAGNLDIAAAKQALKVSKNKTVRDFAQEMVRDHEAVNAKALALVKKLHVTPEANTTSTSLTKAADAERAKLGKLKGAAFDREVSIDCDRLQPQVTWGISPQQVTEIDGRVPDASDAADSEARELAE